MDYGYWGKYKKLHDNDSPRKIWIGPMSRDEMINHFNEFRHNFRPEVSVPDIESADKDEIPLYERGSCCYAEENEKKFNCPGW